MRNAAQQDIPAIVGVYNVAAEGRLNWLRDRNPATRSSWVAGPDGVERDVPIPGLPVGGG